MSPTLILDLPVTTGPNHDGGVLALGPPGQFPGIGDGAALYAVIGDLNRNGQLQNNAAGALPDDSGVIFRVLQDGAAAPGNPFVPYCSVTTDADLRERCGLPGRPDLPDAGRAVLRVRSAQQLRARRSIP